MFQQLMLIGNLGKDPEMRYTPGGKAVTSFSLAVTKKLKEGDKTTWFRISCWEKNAENAHKYLVKGSKVLVVGELEEPRIYTAGDGQQRTSLEVTAHQIKFLSPVQSQEQEPQTQPQQANEDIPF